VGARGSSSGWALLTAVALTSLVLLAPGGAAAATVVNGNFETGTLAGWQVHRALEAGNWFAYGSITDPVTGEVDPSSVREDPIARKRADGPIEAPPQGNYAAVADEINPDALILSQEIALGAGLSHRLNLLAYYNSYVPIAVPTPDSLSVSNEVLAGQANQQYRIDVMRPTAPIESVDPADILLTVFRAQPGSPEVMRPTRLLADLSPFAGQTVRLRIAVAAHEEVLMGGVDAVAVESAPPGHLPSLGSKRSNKLSFGKVKLNPNKGTAILPVRVPGPGKLSAKSARAAAKASASKAKKVPQLIKPVTVKVAKAGTVKLRLQPTNAARGILELKQKLRVKVAVVYKPTDGKPETATVPVVLKLEARPH
jgi:hypothetical protein